LSEMDSQLPVTVDTEMTKRDELIKYIVNLVENNLPELMQSTIDPKYDERAAREVVELGFIDLRHFCASFPSKFQVHEWGSPDIYVIALRSTHRRVLPPWMGPNAREMGDIPAREMDEYWEQQQNSVNDMKKDSELPAILNMDTGSRKVDALVTHIKTLVALNLPDELTQITINPQHNERAAKEVVEMGFRDVRHFCECFTDIFQVNSCGIMALSSAILRADRSIMSDRGSTPAITPNEPIPCTNCDKFGHRACECPLNP
ncbi:hypothetical protein PENTCL1PPCAC_1705, partial [Pristionchus entomophagus]